jgi:hypothetical protein
MLSKIVNKSRFAKHMLATASRNFSHGPYNPLHYKTLLVQEGMPTTEDFYQVLKSEHSKPPPPVYNMRHIHPVRQSGPIPPYDGPYSMEDIKKLIGHMRVPWDHCAQSTDVEELMRRAPGLTRKEALRI